MISESLKNNTTLTKLDLGGDENEVNEQTYKQQKKNKNKQQTRRKKESKEMNKE